PLDVVERFTTQLDAVGAQWTLVRGEVEAARALRRILSDAGARRVAGSDAPLVARLLPERLTRLTREELFTCDAGVTTAQWGIAETGTLVLESARERSRLASLVPPMHVALLSTSRICASLEDALARVDVASQAITLITGPSRTLDIELTLVVGVHGPQVVQGIVLAPLDNVALVRPVEEARRAGVPTVIIDSGLQTDSTVSFVATDNYKGG